MFRKPHHLAPLAAMAACALAAPASAAAAGLTTYQQAVKDSSPDLYWTLDDNSVTDASGNGHAGTPSGVAFGQPGAFGLANTSADFPSGATVTGTPGSGAQVIELWLRPSARGSQVIAGQGDATGTGWELSLNGKKKLILKSAGSTVDPKITVPVGAWTMVDVAWKGTGVWFVTNGGLAKSKEIKNALATAPAPGAATLTLGGSASAAKRLDEVALYPTAPANFAAFKAFARAHFDATALAVNTAPPAVSGTPADGQTLTASPGTWTSATPVTYSYQWLRCDLPASDANQSCDYIDGAASSTYALTPDDVGSYIETEVTAANTAGSTFVDSDTTAQIDPQQPTISGVATEGQILTATAHQSSGPAAAFTLQWQRCPDSTGTGCADIPTATNATYQLTSGDVGQAVRVVATLNGSAVASDATPLVAAAAAAPVAPSNSEAPGVNGTMVVDQTLAVGPGLWSGTPAPSLSYQWRRCVTGADCVDIAGAHGTSYVLTAADLGASIVVRETAQNSEGTAFADSLPQGPVTGAGTGATGGGGNTTADTTTATTTTTGTTPAGATTTGTTTAGTTTTGTTTTGTTSTGTALPTCVNSARKVKTKRAKVRGIGRVRISVKRGIPGARVKVLVRADKRRIAKATFKLDRKVLKGSKRSLKRKVAIKRLKAGRHALRVTLKPKHGKAKALRLVMKIKGC